MLSLHIIYMSASINPQKINLSYVSKAALLAAMGKYSHATSQSHSTMGSCEGKSGGIIHLNLLDTHTKVASVGQRQLKKSFVEPH